MTTITVETDLRALQAQVYDINVANGWFESDRSWDDDLALLHSEVSELLEAYRDHGFEDRTRIACTHKHFQADYDRHDASLGAGFHLCKPEGVGSEVADVLIRLLDTAERRDLDTDLFVSRPDVKPGDHIGQSVRMLHEDIARIYLAPDRSAAAAIVFARLWAATASWGMDLPTETARKIAYNATRGHKHGGKRL